MYMHGKGGNSHRYTVTTCTVVLVFCTLNFKTTLFIQDHLIWFQRPFLCALGPLFYDHLKYKTTLPLLYSPPGGFKMGGPLYICTTCILHEISWVRYIHVHLAYFEFYE